MGALISRRVGWERKIWRALTHNWRISPSDNCTCFPPFPSNNLLIISSNTALSIIPSIVIIIIFFFLSSWPPKQINTQFFKFLTKNQDLSPWTRKQRTPRWILALKQRNKGSDEEFTHREKKGWCILINRNRSK